MPKELTLEFLQRVAALAYACSDRPGAPDDIREAGAEIAEETAELIAALFPPQAKAEQPAP